MALLRRRLHGSTIIEVVVASVIITASFAVAISTISALNANNDVIRKIGYENYIDSLLINELQDNTEIITVESKEETLVNAKAKCCGSENLNEPLLTRRRIVQKHP